MAGDLSTFSVLSSVEGEEAGDAPALKLSLFSMPLVSACFSELQHLSCVYSALQATLEYLGETLKQIGEAWEEIVAELDHKLARYAENLPKGSMAADFLDLLMLGTSSPELEAFLLQELTEKGA